MARSGWACGVDIEACVLGVLFDASIATDPKNTMAEVRPIFEKVL